MDDVIARLCADLEPVPRRFTERRMMLAAGLGLAGAALLWLLVAGPRADLLEAVAGWAFWTKFLYAAVLAGGGFWLVARAGKPGAALAPPLLALAGGVAFIGVHAGTALRLPGADLAGLAMGQSAARAALTIVFLSLPALAAILWALRRLAPTQAAKTGASAGLFAGSEGALLYVLTCTEDAALFVALWYTIGILLTATLGAFLGRLLLRW